MAISIIGFDRIEFDGGRRENFTNDFGAPRFDNQTLRLPINDFGGGGGNFRPPPRPQPITKPILKNDIVKPKNLDPRVLQDIRNLIVYNPPKPGNTIIDLIPPDIITKPVIAPPGIELPPLVPPRIGPPPPPPPPPKPKISRTQGDSRIKEEILSNNVTEELIDVFRNSISFIVNVVDDIYVPVPDIREIEYPTIIRGADFRGADVDFNFSWNSINATYIRIFIGGAKEYIQVSPKGDLTLNIKKDILGKYIPKGVYDSNPDAFKIPISMIPYNTSGREVVAGKKEKFEVVFDKGDLDIPRSVAVNRILDGFSSQFQFNVFTENRFLNHLLHLGNGDNDIITRFQGLALDDESSLILKLYEPLPTSIQPNQKVWISKLQTDPIIETVTIVGEDDHYCPPLKGANFTLEPDNGIGFQIYDDLIASGSTTSTNLINNYTTQLDVDFKKLNIQFASGSTGEVFRFDNFTHYGSAAEKIKNFYYKLQTLETYQANYNDLTEYEIVLGSLEAEGGAYDGFTIISEDGIELLQEAPNFTTETRLQAQKVLEKINIVIQSFDTFERYLYDSNDDSAYPKNSGVLYSSTSSEGVSWYETSVSIAEAYDKNNVNYLVNNLPDFIKEDYQNEDFMLFLDMIGQHFDILWMYINSLSNIRKTNKSTGVGLSNELVYHLLQSMGWDGKKAFDSQFLWEYAFGLNKDGTQKYGRSLKSANEEVWRRLLDNLPYLLKNKGTSRALKTAMACYGVPSSLLTIMEFGGPQDPTLGGNTKFTFDDRTAAINFTNNGEYVNVDWKSVNGSTPNSVEVRVKSETPGNYNIAKVTGGSLDPNEYWRLGITKQNSNYATIDFYVSESWTGNVYTASTPAIPFFNDEYKNIVINRTLTNSTSSFQVYVKEPFGDRIRTEAVTPTITIAGDTTWDTGSLVNLHLGYEFSGSIDEFRLWGRPLEEAVIETHTLLPDATNGNTYTSSTNDLWVRFDFEYPKDRTADNNLLNVGLADDYNVLYGTTIGFPSASSYPYQYTPYDRTVTAKVPSLGFNYSDKIRFETQTLVTDLSHKVRATKKSFDQAPIDSSRLGLFFSPNKELNMDILKSFGEFNIDNYIGNPSDEFKTDYNELKVVRDYYFERLNRNIDEYINLVRLIDKSLFDVLQDLVPERAKVSKGLLIEPHLLERSKTQWKPATSETGHYESNVEIDYVELTSDNPQYLATLDAEQDVNLNVEINNYHGIITDVENVNLEFDYLVYNAEIGTTDNTFFVVDYPTYEMNIDAGLDEPTLESSVDEIFGFTAVGMDPELVVNGGFGLYAENGVGIVTTLDIFGNMTSSRQQIYKIKESYIEKERVQTEGWPATTGSEQVKYELVDVQRHKYVISQLPFGSTEPTVGGNILEVTPLNGYFPSHYRRVNNLGEGLRRSFFKGSQQTTATTPDGLDPVETFTTNPNILRVANTGRGSGEPILEVD